VVPPNPHKLGEGAPDTRPHTLAQKIVVQTSGVINMNKKTWLIILWLVLALIAFRYGNRWLQPENILSYRDTWHTLAQNHPLVSALVFALLYVVATTVSIPGGAPLSMIAGFLFGRWWGTLIVVVSATLGALLVLWLVRYLFYDWARVRLERSPTAQRLIQGFTEDAFHYLLFLRLLPVFPFWLVNIASAFTPVSTRTYGLATLIGIIPASFIYVNLGRTFGTINQLDDLASPRMGLALGLLAALSLLPVVMKRLRGESRA